MDLLQLQYFQTIARLENISRASEILYVAQPNLSTNLRRLEDELGVALFERRKGRIRLTPTGKLFLSYVDEVLDKLDEGVASARQTDRRADDHVRVASVIVDLMGEMLDGFLTRHPNVSFRQFHCRNDEVVGKVLSGEADFGFVFGTPPLQGLEYIEIDSCERIVQLAASHPLAARGSVSLRDLAGERLIVNLSRDDAALAAELARSGRFRAETFFECDDNRVEVSMLTAGGISIAPVSNFLKLRGSGAQGLACLRIREELPLSRLGMFRRTGVLLPRAALRFYESVSEFFRSEAELARAFTSTLPDDPGGRP